MENKPLNITTTVWLNYEYSLTNSILTNESIYDAVERFNEDVLSKLAPKIYMLLIFKIVTQDNLYRSISTMQRVSINDLAFIKEAFVEYWGLKSENYQQEAIDKILFEYKIIADSQGITTPKLHSPTIIEKAKLLRFGTFNFPTTMDINLWGSVEYSNNDTEAIVSKENSNSYYYIKFEDDTMYVSYQISGKELVSFKDTLLDRENLGTFSRHYKNQIFYFKDSNLESKFKTFDFKFIEKLESKAFYPMNIITLDLETFVKDNKIVPYAASFYDGKIKKSFYLSDYTDHNEMLKDCISTLFCRKYHGHKVYIHNFSNFDGIFLFNILNELSDEIKPVINDGQFVNIFLKFGNKKYTLHIRDSFLMLPSALSKLAKAFNVEEKSLFPYRFVTEERVKNNYEGPVPSIEFFDKISASDYEKYLNEFTVQNWNLKDETIKYCEQDCVTLFQVLTEFLYKNFLDTRVRGSNYVSLPSLAFANYRTMFMNEDSNIPKLYGEVYHFIKQGYSGGAVDVYIPYGKNIYRYDVNSLYPTIMRNYKMPTGQPTLCEGDNDTIMKIIFDDNKYSFVEVDVFCPDYIKAPLLLTKIKEGGVLKTIAPVGEWSGVYTSSEIIRAIELGYSFKLHRAVYFEAKNLFKDYVDFYYDKKKYSSKNSSNYTISKLMLNSLYGRFGMSPYLYKHAVVNDEDIIKLSENNIINERIQLKDGKDLISYKPIKQEDFTFSSTSTSVASAAAITAGARVYMSKFKNMDGYKLYYSDTDSIDLDKPLPEEFVGDELGQFKLEHIFKEAIYLAPKVYAGLLENGEYTKVKGLKDKVHFSEFKPLLEKDFSIKKDNQKWYRNLGVGEIEIKDQLYTLSVTESKRQIIYDNNNIFSNTKALVLKDSNLVKNDEEKINNDSNPKSNEITPSIS